MTINHLQTTRTEYVRFGSGVGIHMSLGTVSEIVMYYECVQNNHVRHKTMYVCYIWLFGPVDPEGVGFGSG